MAAEDGRRTAFLDRDGTLIEDVGYPSDPEQVRLLPGAAAGVRRLREAGFATVVISNQSGIGRGLLTEDDLGRVHGRMLELLGEADATLDGAYYCPHSPEDGCDCRKPRTGLIERAREDLGLDSDGCYFIGDKASDIEAGSAAGCSTVLLGAAEPGAAAPTWRASDWDEVVTLLTGEQR